MLSGGLFASGTGFPYDLFNRMPQSPGLVKHPGVPIVIFAGNVGPPLAWLGYRPRKDGDARGNLHTIAN